MPNNPSREAFEAAWIARGLPSPSRSTEPGYTDKYDLPIAQNGWVMWQAGAQHELEVCIGIAEACDLPLARELMERRAS